LSSQTRAQLMHCYSDWQCNRCQTLLPHADVIADVTSEVTEARRPIARRRGIRETNSTLSACDSFDRPVHPVVTASAAVRMRQAWQASRVIHRSRLDRNQASILAACMRRYFFRSLVEIFLSKCFSCRDAYSCSICRVPVIEV